MEILSPESGVNQKLHHLEKLLEWADSSFGREFNRPRQIFRCPLEDLTLFIDRDLISYFLLEFFNESSGKMERMKLTTAQAYVTVKKYAPDDLEEFKKEFYLDNL